LIGLICTAAVAHAGNGGGIVARAILDGSKNQDNGAKAQNDQHTGKRTNVFFGIIRIGKTDNPKFRYDQTGTQNVTATVPVNVGGSK
jgi:hypothetical protein